MKPKTLVLLMTSMACGLAASYLVARSQSEQTVPVLVARQATARYATLHDFEARFELRQVPRAELPQGFRNPATPDQIRERARDHVIEKALKADEPLSLDYLVDKSHGGLGAEVRKGCTALAVRVTAESSSGGFIQPDNYVQVLGTVKRPTGERKAMVLLQRIRVLAVDQTPDRSPDQVAKVANTITLEVTSDEAKLLRVAQEDAPLTLLLMSFRDADPDLQKIKESLSRELTAAEIQARKGEAVEPAEPADQVLVARKALAEGAALTDAAKLFELRAVPRRQLPARPVTGFGPLQAKGLRLIRPLREGECLTLDHLAAKDKRDARIITIVQRGRAQDYVWNEGLGRFTTLEEESDD